MTDLVWLGAIFAGLLLTEWMLNRCLNPYLARRRANKWLREIRSGKQHCAREPEYEISVDKAGFVVERLGGPTAGPVAVHWSEVVRVLALKRDLGMVDQICLAFVCRDGASVELDEEMGGWSALTEALPSHLSGCVPWTEWFRKVAHPPFATNLTEIYVRSTGP